MKALAIIDSFKGTLSSKELGEITKEVFTKNNISCDYISVADGGEGFLDAINADAKKVEVKVHDPLFRLINCEYLLDNDVAYIEMAKSSGLTLLAKEELNPLVATTYGLGEQIVDAINRNAKKIIIGIGGSATNDGGCGMLEALGAKFYSQDGLLTKMNNQQLGNVEKVDLTAVDELLKNVEIIVLTDVDNPLLGEFGATAVFSKQKGADEAMQVFLEKNLIHFTIVTGFNGMFPGAGAAGGVGYALQQFCHAKFQLGLHYILDSVNYNQLVKQYNYVITGEGSVDSQSLRGKVVFEILRRTSENSNAKTIIVCGSSEIEQDNIYPIVPNITSLEESMNNPKESYNKLISDIAKKIRRETMKYKAAIFDLDGTLLNTIEDITDALNLALTECGLEEITTDDAKYFTGSGVAILIERTLAKYPEEVRKAKYDKLKDLYCKYYDRMKSIKTRPYDGINDLIKGLKENGLKIAVLSNKPHNDTLGVIKQYFGENVFDVVFGQREGVPVKPHPQGVLDIIDILKLDKNQIMYIGDTNVDMATAKSASLFAVGVTYGFRSRQELIEANADVIFDKPIEILSLLSE